ncbi:MAG: GH92 family glycosyl hydrolase [Bacteroidota bacterium]
MKRRPVFPIVFTVLFILLIISVIVFIPKNQKEIRHNTQYADPFIGTGGHGHTFPGATLPFGMVQISPDTRLTGWDGCSGYHYTDTIIHGFSHTHLSGTGVSDYGDVLIMPVTGEPVYENSENAEHSYSSSFDKESEKAGPGYYAVHLNEPNIDAEFTCTRRTAFHKYGFKEDTENIHFIIDLTHRDKVINAGIKKINDTDIAGFRRSNAWATDQHLYFYARFSEEFKAYHAKGSGLEENESFDIFGKDIKASVKFSKPEQKEIGIKVGISAVSIEGARKNLMDEAEGLSFDQALELARSEWNDELSDILVNGGSEKDKTKFYSALYHAYIAPNTFSDTDGTYRGTDLEVHSSKNHTQYTVFSLWDTYRATHPLFTITQQERSKDFIKTFLKHYQEGGKLPVWELAGNYTGCMIGYHAVPVMLDAYAKGIIDKDGDLALEAMQHSATLPHLGLPAWMEKGYIGVEDEHESVSKALEYAYDDWCIAQMAKLQNNEKVYNEYIARAQQYKNHFDPETKLMRARLNGDWIKPFDPAEVNFNYTEANAWQYSFYVPHDINNWIEMMGGRDKLCSLLDSLFSATDKTSGRHQVDITGLIGQYAHGNEPSHHIAYLYNYCGKPWKTQKVVKHIMNEMYTTEPDGYIGNEDCGQMSAWYVFSALGFYPVNPANGIYDIGSPLFDTAVIQLENNKEFRITAENLTDKNIYVQSVELNGEAWNKSYIHHQDIMSGGNLHFVMGKKPCRDFGTDKADIYLSEIDAEPIAIAPVIESEHRTFEDSMLVTISMAHNDKPEIFYTTDGSQPDKNDIRYSEGFYIKNNCQVKAVAYRGEKSSGLVSARFTQLDKDTKLQLESEYSEQYNAGGKRALIDGIRGGDDFRTGQWQGYKGQDLEAVVDLGSEKTFSKAGIGFLQDIKSWIWMPVKVEFWLAGNSGNFEPAGKIKPKTADDAYGVFTETFEIKTNNKPVRYIKIRAVNYGIIPDWHPGANHDTWLFTDEIYYE